MACMLEPGSILVEVKSLMTRKQERVDFNICWQHYQRLRQRYEFVI